MKNIFKTKSQMYPSDGPAYVYVINNPNDQNQEILVFGDSSSLDKHISAEYDDIIASINEGSGIPSKYEDLVYQMEDDEIDRKELTYTYFSEFIDSYYVIGKIVR